MNAPFHAFEVLLEELDSECEEELLESLELEDELDKLDDELSILLVDELSYELDSEKNPSLCELLD